ncbi:MAG: GatB/YqeY domain-containing protein [Actinomycetota bacterium]
MSVPTISTRLRDDLTAALKARDPVTVAALRSALTALDNAGAVEVPASRVEGTEHIAGATAGVGSTDIARRVLTESDVTAILRSQIEEHSRAASEYARIGRDDIAERLRSEAEVLAAYLAGPTDGAAGP